MIFRDFCTYIQCYISFYQILIFCATTKYFNCMENIFFDTNKRLFYILCYIILIISFEIKSFLVLSCNKKKKEISKILTKAMTVTCFSHFLFCILVVFLCRNLFMGKICRKNKKIELIFFKHVYFYFIR